MTLYTLTTIVLSGVGLLLFDEQRDFQVPMSSPLSPVSGTTIIGFLIMFSAHVLNLYLSGPIVVKPEQIEYASTGPISKSHSSIPKKKVETEKCSSDPTNIELSMVTTPMVTRDVSTSLDESGSTRNNLLLSSSEDTLLTVEEKEELFVS